MIEIIFFTMLAVLALIVLIVAVPLFIEYREVLKEQEPRRIYPRDREYQEAVTREAEYFRSHPDQWISR